MAILDGLPPPIGFAATGNGDPGTLVSAPVLASMENTVMFEFSMFDVSRNLPCGSTAN